MAISDSVKADAAARKAQIQSQIDKKTLEKAEHDGASATLTAEIVSLTALLADYVKDIPSPSAAP